GHHPKTILALAHRHKGLFKQLRLTLDLILSLPAFRDIVEEVRHADYRSFGIAHSVKMNANRGAASIGPFYNYVYFTNGNPVFQNFRDRRIDVRHKYAVGAVEAVRSAEPFVGIADLGLASPNACSLGVVPRDEAIRCADTVSSHGKAVEKVLRG